MKGILIRTVIALIGLLAVIFIPYYSGVIMVKVFTCLNELPYLYWLIGLATDLFLFIIISIGYFLIQWVIKGDVF